ncbi:galactose mutarotase [Bifidobacterium goeldii]|uniref:Aldose 1-epimerase n=1 Tax=Bifidobacterium goeldii TaxID=2306975 RepID=A0A430FC25_9BIFI|nr:aldose epimerase family protein [Bifidobacterium goeldii]RSX50395.1 galactose mutarotase [Bifidobacterium goeldii]
MYITTSNRTLPDSRPASSSPTAPPSVFNIASSSGIAVRITDYGARLMRVIVPDRHGTPTNVLLGMPTALDYLHDDVCLGAIIGRNANRIANAHCTINGVTYTLSANDGSNNSHSGPRGFEHRRWQVVEAASNAVTLTLDSPEGDQGFPGHMSVQAHYAIVGNTLSLTIDADCNTPTIANMTNHSYWNLDGEDSGDMLDQTLTIPTPWFCPISNDSIPLHTDSVAGTAMDFRKPRCIGEALRCGRNVHDPQIERARGYNHAFVFEDAHGVLEGAAPADPITGMRTVAVAASERTGITMTQRANTPAVLFYSAGYMDGVGGASGHVYHPYAGFALEAGFVPNSINDDSQISSELPAGQHYRLCIAWQFDVSD